MSSIEDFRLHEIDILDAPELMNCFEAEKPDVVVHLAALAGVRPSILTPGRYQKVNVEGTTNVLEAMRSAGVGHLVFGSSSSVYGERTQTPFRETDSVDHPVSPYAATKKAEATLCDLPSSVRDERRLLEVLHGLWTKTASEMAISKFTDALISNRPITIYGDGTSARDYTFVSDIVRGIFASVQNPDGYRVINLGGRQPISFKPAGSGARRDTFMYARTELFADAAGRRDRHLCSGRPSARVARLSN